MAENGTIEVENVIIECQKCNHQIGQMEKIGEQSWPVIGGVLVDYIKGVCTYCGQEFYWSITEQQLSRLVRNVLEQKKKYGA